MFSRWNLSILKWVKHSENFSVLIFRNPMSNIFRKNSFYWYNRSLQNQDNERKDFLNYGGMFLTYLIISFSLNVFVFQCEWLLILTSTSLSLPTRMAVWSAVSPASSFMVTSAPHSSSLSTILNCFARMAVWRGVLPDLSPLLTPEKKRVHFIFLR